MLDLRQLQALTAVAQTGSVARAAKQLGWSQPSVDYHLRISKRFYPFYSMKKTDSPVYMNDIISRS